MPATYAIGIDLGGTNIKGGVCDEHHAVLVTHAIETQAERGFEHVLQRMAGLVDTLLHKVKLTKTDEPVVGIGAPGPLSREDGTILCAPNLPGWRNVPLRRRLADATGLRVVLENDANAAAYGEFVAGAGPEVTSLVMLTLGTGIGGGIVLDGQLWRGRDDSAAEIGHTIIVPGGRPCPCGQSGCYERYASANAVAERLVEAVQSGAASTLAATVAAGNPIDARDVLRAAQAGDQLAAHIWDETCYYLAVGCLNIEHMLAPDAIVFAGGLTHAGERLLGPTLAHAQRLRWRIPTTPPTLALAKVGVDAGIIGAAALARIG